jgi:hypothetical protein
MFFGLLLLLVVVVAYLDDSAAECPFEEWFSFAVGLSILCTKWNLREPIRDDRKRSIPRIAIHDALHRISLEMHRTRFCLF